MWAAHLGAHQARSMQKDAHGGAVSVVVAVQRTHVQLCRGKGGREGVGDAVGWRTHAEGQRAGRTCGGEKQMGSRWRGPLGRTAQQAGKCWAGCTRSTVQKTPPACPSGARELPAPPVMLSTAGSMEATTCPSSACSRRQKMVSGGWLPESAAGARTHASAHASPAQSPPNHIPTRASPFAGHWQQPCLYVPNRELKQARVALAGAARSSADGAIDRNPCKK